MPQQVEAAIVIWQEGDILIVPSSALFRSSDQWAVFRTQASQAELTPVRIGQRNGAAAQILEGLQADDTVVTYPSDAIHDGTPVIQR